MNKSATSTVTFLFTDIEGSTRLWDQHPEAMKPALARHDRIIQSTIELHGGHVFKTGGDSFCAAFGVAPNALGAAVEAQQLLAAEPWGEIGELRVRMALHTGAVNEREGDYFGPALNRVARLLSAGHGGQTLLSLATEELVRDHLPDGAQLRDLGSHRLRDLIRPEQIFEIIVSSLPSEFPELKTLDARPNNLQTQPTLLLGREHEVEQVCAQLGREDVRLLTLTGPGGTGKTRLSLQIAADLLHDYQDGVFFVELAPISDPALVMPAIAQILGVKESGGRSMLSCLQDYLHEKSLLLILDNFEQVTAAAPQIAELLAHAPRLNLLVSSRIPLHLRGEHEFPVPPLALPDYKHLPALAALSQFASVALFIERAKAVKADFAVNNENAPAVAEICVRLDGLPLALELAAARIKLLSPQAMLVRLKDPLKFLSGGARDLSARQQTLRGAIAWSHDLLDENEKRLFRRLGVFVGGTTLEAIEAVCDADGDLGVDAFEGVASLVDKSLLRQQDAPDGESRFLMLEMIREFAVERLTESGESEAWKNRHADFFVAFAEQAESGIHSLEPAKWMMRIDTEYENLRAAHEWFLQRGDAQRGLRLAAALAEFWVNRGRRPEGERWLSEMLALPDAAQPTLARAKGLRCVGWFFMMQNKSEGHPMLEESVQLYRELGDKRGLLIVMAFLASSHSRNGDQGKARQVFEETLIMARELGDKWSVALGLQQLGSGMIRLGEIIAARAMLEESLKLARELAHKALLAQCLSSLSAVMRFQGEPEKARAFIEELIAIRREADGRDSAYHLGLHCKFTLYSGDYKAAAEWYKAAIELSQQSGDKMSTATFFFHLAEIALYEHNEVAARTFWNDFLAAARAAGHDDFLAGFGARWGEFAVERGQIGEARRLYHESLALRRKMGDKKGIAEVLKLFGDLACEQGDDEEVDRFYAEALEVAREYAAKEFLGETLGRLGQAAFDQSDNAKALGFWNEQIDLYREPENKIGMGWGLFQLGLMAYYQGRDDEASQLFDESLTLFQTLGFVPGVARLLLSCATVKQAQGNLAEARTLSEQSLALFRRVTNVEHWVGFVLTYMLGGTKDVAYASQCLARVLCAQGDLPAAQTALKESLEISRIRCDRRGFAEGFAGCARLALAQNNPERAARFFGAADRLHQIVGPRLNPFDHRDQATVLANLRTTLGEAPFTTAWADGRALTTEQAITESLS